ncbi:uncharacterized protein HMPREF1541_05979 [Cyphellophora europaea CBS 101466]|uniref:Asparaginase n=1 Tax=Cyphellophora europaea (strain CBS 101466) TaxID=1220924 RepID=W2RVF0_CYPE1|nr:uncharacterized protein HMPREF1541_05979 [Cyphellophora europaea CBS 101466]ETN39753.1 hypothetical protein HMPREF1541_05979 [Cyphellophora europaea CBS 101466]
MANAPVAPFKPTLILHGGAGALARSHLPPELYARYRHSLLIYLTDTRALLDQGATALDAAVHAVSRMEDDELFNCGRGSVFNLAGEIEMEASVMVASVRPEAYGDCEGGGGPAMGGFKKRAAAVSLLRRTRHPIQLAREVLLEGDGEGAGVSGMHCHLSGREVEEWGWSRGLEKKGKEWFWTRRRWEEHKRELGHGHVMTSSFGMGDLDGMILPSQGTVGAVCLDRYGNVAVTTSTGGLTNKKPGRIGDTPTVGAGFWAESFAESAHEASGDTQSSSWTNAIGQAKAQLFDIFADCLGPAFAGTSLPTYHRLPGDPQTSEYRSNLLISATSRSHVYTGSLAEPSSQPRSHRAVALSGTGNGDSFLRTSAARSVGARCRYSSSPEPLSKAVSAVAGPGGELQQSAGTRFGRTGEGEGGIIGIEVGASGAAEVVFDFNCLGMWRAWYEKNRDGKEVPKVMVFREEYQ